VRLLKTARLHFMNGNHVQSSKLSMARKLLFIVESSFWVIFSTVWSGLLFVNLQSVLLSQSAVIHTCLVKVLRSFPHLVIFTIIKEKPVEMHKTASDAQPLNFVSLSIIVSEKFA
jgi:hypothetical protein